LEEAKTLLIKIAFDIEMVINFKDCALAGMVVVYYHDSWYSLIQEVP